MPPPPEPRAGLAELLMTMSAPCPAGSRPSAQAEAGREQLFVEAAILDMSSAAARDASLEHLEALPQSAEVQLVAVPHIIADFDQRAEMAWQRSGPALGTTFVRRWSVVPRRSDDANVLDVELELEPTTAGHLASGSRRTVTFSATVRDNEPALARVELDAALHRSLVFLFRTFEIHGEQDLRAIFECKMLQHNQAMHRRGAASP